jgi:hypothetical protein
MGFAAWLCSEFEEDKPPVRWGVIKPNFSKSEFLKLDKKQGRSSRFKEFECAGPHRVSWEKAWYWRMETVAVQFRQVLDILKPKIVYSEFPQFYQDPGGEMCAARGDLQKLTFSVGVLAECCFNRNIDFVPILVSEWKGQLPKKIVNERILQILGPVACREFDTHIWDAVGIGLFAKGHFE